MTDLPDLLTQQDIALVRQWLRGERYRPNPSPMLQAVMRALTFATWFDPDDVGKGDNAKGEHVHGSVEFEAFVAERFPRDVQFYTSEPGQDHGYDTIHQLSNSDYQQFVLLLRDAYDLGVEVENELWRSGK